MLKGIRRRLAEMAMIALMAGSAMAQDLMVEKKTFEMPSYTTVSGTALKNVKVGWEAYGTLNADKSNAILIPHFFPARATRLASTRPMTSCPAIGII